jgi:hypothetical protein
MQLAYKFGAKEVDPVIDAIHRAVADTSYSVRCLPNDGHACSPTDDSLASLPVKLGRGEIASFLVASTQRACPVCSGDLPLL